MSSEKTQGKPANPLGTQPISSLIWKFAVPAIVSQLVIAAYNITDQIFIGKIVGMYGNAATNIAFPLVILCGAVALLLAIGTATNFNINLGAGNKDEAATYVGSGIFFAAVSGVALMLLTLIFLKPMLVLFGATENIMPYAIEYTRITAIGIPFLLFSTFGVTLVRADGSPTYSMISIIVGAVLNIFLDALFMIVFKWGIAGSAWATVIGQALSCVLVARYLLKFRSVKLGRDSLKPRKSYVLGITRLGTAAFINHFIMMVVQVVLNNVFKTYGALSVYGADIPIAVAGVTSKIMVIVLAFTVGIAQSCQPIWSFNMGAKNYSRVTDTYKVAAVFVLTFSAIAFMGFQLFPRELVSIFGTGDELYFQFAERYMRIFMMMVCLFGIQPLTINFFTSTGKAKQGILLTLSRQGLFLLPLLIVMPIFFGIDGALYAAPIADIMAVILCVVLAGREIKALTAMAGASAKTAAQSNI